MHNPSPILLIGGAGYVGSRLAQELRAARHDLTTLDTRPAPGRHLCKPYQALRPDELERFGTVLWFAGHSSVRDAVADPAGALRNNLSDLWDLRSRLQPHQGFVYASSASVYTMARPEPCAETFRPRSLLNVYDQTKAWFDTLMTTRTPAGGLAGGRFWGLRLGTVAGASPRLRTDTVFNAMTLDAQRTGIVHLRNEDVHRGVLGLPDLARAVGALLTTEVPPGLYNLASFHTTLGALADRIAGRFGARVSIGPPTAGYDFRMSCTKWEGAAGFRFHDTVDTLADELVACRLASAGLPA